MLDNFQPLNSICVSYIFELNYLLCTLNVGKLSQLCQTLEGSLWAVSKQIFVSKGSFWSFSVDLQDLHTCTAPGFSPFGIPTFAPPQAQPGAGGGDRLAPGEGPGEGQLVLEVERRGRGLVVHRVHPGEARRQPSLRLFPDRACQWSTSRNKSSKTVR